MYNDDASRIVRLGEMSDEEARDYMKNHSNDALANVEAVIGAYAVELLTIAEAAGLNLDLSYDTIENVPLASIILYNKQYINGYDEFENKLVTCRTLAGYFTVLAINNHDFSIEVKVYTNKRNDNRPEQWADRFVIKFNHKKNSDFLPYIWDGANNQYIEIENGFMIDVNPLIDVYERLTGLNLAEKGLANMVLTHQDGDVIES